MEGGKLRMEGGSVKNCRAVDHSGGAIFQTKGEVYCKNVDFEYNEAGSGSGGALYCNTTDPTWFIGCSFIGNKCGVDGGAISMTSKYGVLTQK